MDPDPIASLPPVDFVAVDVETACSRVSSICQIGIVGFKDGAEAFAWQSLIDPADDFSPSHMRVHGISCDHVLGKPSFADLHDTLTTLLAGRVTVAHSLLDKGAIAAACEAHDLPSIECTWVDSVRVAKRAWPELPSHRLNLLARHLKLRHKHHDALSDARVAGMIVVKAIVHTGIGLADWLAPGRQQRGAAPAAARSGPLLGRRVAILGASRDSALAHRLAASGARVTATVGTTSHLLVISNTQPFGRFVHAHAEYRRAEELRREGRPIEIVTEDELLARLAGL